uniref:Large ribosomal subunit protein uL23c n=1 Tax=Nephroselmis olivacea TaxID=31312 RepID=RK23_NEPOL|nr:ribosomal protein L23 [Nephroselmis olivacea]Q9TL17.1 RecName: Full=Large ribosomal subunit protein uL23c; AltName: Full=50S ribosomal protein L23, chloroplastic [Nephroselmis olivacea]AAD54799.1 ribosomal protein L23 [Nephroselmis olivacea]
MIIDLVKRPVITEKATRILEKNQYTFDVELSLTKPKIKALIEKAFKVEVVSVNTHRPPRRKRRLGTTQGYLPRYKRAIITLKRGFMIPLTPF